MSRSIDAVTEALATVRRRIKQALDEDRTPWTAVAALTKQEVSLLREEAALLGDDPRGDELTAADVRAEILALPDDLVQVAADAVRDRRKGGRR